MFVGPDASVTVTALFETMTLGVFVTVIDTVFVIVLPSSLVAVNVTV